MTEKVYLTGRWQVVDFRLVGRPNGAGCAIWREPTNPSLWKEVLYDSPTLVIVADTHPVFYIHESLVDGELKDRS